MFAFDNVNGALAHAVHFGATVVFNEDGATSVTAWCFDPDGNTFALHHRKREAKDGNPKSSLSAYMTSPYDVSGRNSEWRTLLLGRQLVALAGSRGLPRAKWTWNDMRSVLPKLEPPQKPLPVYSTINAASSLLTTAQDYANVASALARQPNLTSPQIAVTDRIAWGLGVGLELSKDRTAFYCGDNDGFKAMLVADTGRPDGAIVLTNSDGGMKLALKAIERLIGPSHPLLGWVGAMYR